MNPGRRRWGPVVAAVGTALAAVLLAAGAARAMEPPRKGEVVRLKRAGLLEERLALARRVGNHRADPGLVRNMLLRTRQRVLESRGLSGEEAVPPAFALAPPRSWRGMPTKGRVRVLALLVDFKDYPAANTAEAMHARLFGDGGGDAAPYESLAEYYLRASYDQLDLRDGVTLGWYHAPNARSHYDNRREELIREAFDSYDGSVDFSQFDNDRDGAVDYFLVFWTGPDNGWANFWWGYQTSWGDTGYALDGVTFGTYSWQWEAMPAGGTFNPRVAMHETGHALGLPDLYDYDDKIGPRGGVGGLDMMHGNKGDFNCFSKWLLDWIAPAVVADGRRSLSLRTSGTERDAVLVWPWASVDEPFSEFFMVQNRSKAGNDDAADMPGNGLLVWHVDSQLTGGGESFRFDNSYTEHKLVRLMEADGLEQIEQALPADAGDYYVSGRSFTPTSLPNSSRYDGARSEVSVSNISAAGATMTATFRVGASLSGGTPTAPSGLGVWTDAVTEPGVWRQARYFYGYRHIDRFESQRDACGVTAIHAVGWHQNDYAEYLMKGGGTWNRLILRGRAARPTPVTAAIFVDGRQRATVSWTAGTNCSQDVSVEIPSLAYGTHAVAVRFVNDGLVGGLDRNLYLEAIAVQPSASLGSVTRGQPSGSFQLGAQTNEVTDAGAWRSAARFYGRQHLDQVAWDADRCGGQRLYAIGWHQNDLAEYLMELGGEYRHLVLRGKADRPGPVEVEVWIDGTHYTNASWDAGTDSSQDVSVGLWDVPFGVHAVAVKFVNDSWNSATGEDRNLYLEALRASKVGVVKVLTDASWQSLDREVPNWQLRWFQPTGWRTAISPYPSASRTEDFLCGTASTFIWDWPGAGAPVTGKDGPTSAWFRRTFYLSLEPADIARAEAVIGADDDFDLYVNGQLAFSDWNGVVQGAPYRVDIRPYLYDGENSIAVRARDTYGIHEWLFLDVTIE